MNKLTRNTIFVENLESYRNKMNITKVEMAKKMHISRATYYRIINKEQIYINEQMIINFAKISGEIYWIAFAMNNKEFENLAKEFDDDYKKLGINFNLLNLK